jgi:Cu2+-exporting ATPase
MNAIADRLSSDEILLASRHLEGELWQTILSVPGIHCGGCIARIESALGALAGVERARVSLSTKRVAITWRSAAAPPPLRETLSGLGYEGHLHDAIKEDGDPALGRLIRALAVAGFAAANIMALSVSIWSGAGDGTRSLFYWISAAIALPALVYSGRIFFVPAWRNLRQGRINMEVPISVALLLTFGMSLYDTIRHQPYAYFDAVISLLFVLLIGRTLDHVMRQRARSAVKGLERLAAFGARVLDCDGAAIHRPTSEILAGMTILLGAGERVPVDAVVLEGASDIDAALATGESALEPVGAGAALRAGTLNLTGPLTIRATAAARDSFLAEMVRLMETAEGGRSGYRLVADRASRLYAPLVHGAALTAFVIWLVASGDLHLSITIAIAVLIITCPCALGLAVPMVQVVAARLLFEHGIMARDGSAMERLAQADIILFDKTGTLTLGKPVLRNVDMLRPDSLAVAAAMAAHSNHPYSRALARAVPPAAMKFDLVVERPGLGIEARLGAEIWRLGRGEWAAGADESGILLSLNGRPIEAFAFDDAVRAGAERAIERLRDRGFALQMISGDQPAIVARLARTLGIETARADMLPADKIDHIESLAGQGRKVLMIGDGINDAPALAAAHVSIAPANAADIGREAADFVFLHESLEAVPFAIAVSLAAQRLIRQNFALAAIYNLVAIPVAIAGLVTPLIAALAMSSSSLLVVGNALRLRAGR